MLDFIKTSDFARFVVFGLTAVGIQIDPEQVNAITAGGLALVALIHAVRAAFAKKATPSA